WLDGVRDTVGVILDIGCPDNGELEHLQQLLASMSTDSPLSLAETQQHLHELMAWSTRFADHVAAAPGRDLAWWPQALTRQCQDLYHELLRVAPWCVPPAGTTDDNALLSLIGSAFNSAIPTLRELSLAEDILLPLLCSEPATSQPTEWSTALRQCIVD